MPRDRKDYRSLNIRMDSKVHEERDRYCEKTNNAKTAIVEKAVEDFIKAETKAAMEREQVER